MPLNRIEKCPCPTCDAPTDKIIANDTDKVRCYMYNDPLPALEHRSPDQKGWHDLRDELGEEEASKEVVRQLKQFIEHIESDGWPKVFSAHLNTTGEDIFCHTDSVGNVKEGEKSFITSIRVCITYPWPG